MKCVHESEPACCTAADEKAVTAAEDGDLCSSLVPAAAAFAATTDCECSSAADLIRKMCDVKAEVDAIKEKVDEAKSAEGVLAQMEEWQGISAATRTLVFPPAFD